MDVARSVHRLAKTTNGRARWGLLLLLSTALSCRNPSTSAPTPPPLSAADRAALQRAGDAATELARTLRARLASVLQQQGPAAAVNVCANEARQLADDVRQRTGVTVGRSSLRLRNATSNVAPSWVATWLQTQGERPAQGVRGFERIEQGHARVVRPIAVEGVCVLCHGAREGIVPDVRAVLDARYPSDRAVGYEPGALRGALWAELAIDRGAH